MDAAFNALVLLALILPGAALIFAYGRHLVKDAGVSFSLSNATAKTFFAIVFAVPLNAIWVKVANWWVACKGQKVDIDTVVYLATGHYDDAKHFDRAIAELSHCIGGVAAYFITLYAFSAAVGWLLFLIVHRWRLDLKWSVLRFPGDWDYVVRGELNALPRVPEGSTGALAAVAVEIAGEAYVYIGAVLGSLLGDKGKLDKLLLAYPVRYKMEDFLDGKTEKKLGATPSHQLDAEIVVIPEREIKNVAFTYIDVSQVGSSSTKP